MSWEKEEKEKGMTRREWVQIGVGAGLVASLAGLGGLVAGQILPPPYKFTGEIRETIQYTKFPTPQWWNNKAGTTVRVSDFQEWQGATGVWRGLFQDDKYVPGTGFPVIIVRIKRESQFFSVPPPSQMPAPLPTGFNLYFDDATLDAANGGSSSTGASTCAAIPDGTSWIIRRLAATTALMGPRPQPMFSSSKIRSTASATVPSTSPWSSS